MDFFKSLIVYPVVLGSTAFIGNAAGIEWGTTACGLLWFAGLAVATTAACMD